MSQVVGLGGWVEQGELGLPRVFCHKLLPCGWTLSFKVAETLSTKQAGDSSRVSRSKSSTIPKVLIIEAVRLFVLGWYLMASPTPVIDKLGLSSHWNSKRRTDLQPFLRPHSRGGSKFTTDCLIPPVEINLEVCNPPSCKDENRNSIISIRMPNIPWGSSGPNINPIHLWFPHDLLSKKDLAEKRQCLPRFHWHVC